VTRNPFVQAVRGLNTNPVRLAQEEARLSLEGAGPNFVFFCWEKVEVCKCRVTDPTGLSGEVGDTFGVFSPLNKHGAPWDSFFLSNCVSFLCF